MENNNLLRHNRVQPILDNVPILFRNFSPEDIRKFLLLGTLKEFERGDVIISEADGISNSGWLVAQGSVSLFIQETFIGRLTSGDFIGEAFLFTKQPVDGALVAATPAAVIQFNRNDIITFFEKRPDRLFKVFVINLIELQHQKLRYAGKKIAQIQNKLLNIDNS